MTDDFETDELTAAEKAEMKADRERRIRTEKTRIRRMLTKHDIDAEILRGVDRLIDRAAFYAVTLADLEDEINRDGCTDTYQNGQYQSGTKTSPAVQTHATFSQRFFAVMKQLTELLPEVDDGKKKSGTGLLDYCNGR